MHPHAEDSPVVPKSLLKGANRRRIVSSDEEEEAVAAAATKGFMSDSDSDDEALVAKAGRELSEEEVELPEEEEESFASAVEPSNRPHSRVDLMSQYEESEEEEEDVASEEGESGDEAASGGALVCYCGGGGRARCGVCLGAAYPAYASASPPPAVLCDKVHRPRPAHTVHRIRHPVRPFLSPSCFSVQLPIAEAEVVELEAAMTASPPPAVPGWKVRRHQVVALLHGGAWCRGMAVNQVGTQLSVYRLDHGDMVTVSMAAVRPLPAQHLAPPAGALQCCMVGLGPVGGGEVWEEDTLHLFASLVLGDPAYPLMVQLMGKVAGGRWAVRLLGVQDGQDVAEWMVYHGMVRRRG